MPIPKNDRILVEPIVEEQKGLFTPEAADRPKPGKVIAISRKVEESGETHVGEIVLYHKNAGTEVSVDGRPHLLMREADLLLGFTN